MQPEWGSFIAHIDRLSSESEKGLVELMEDQCLEANRLLESMDGEVGACLLFLPERSAYDALLRLHTNSASAVVAI